MGKGTTAPGLGSRQIEPCTCPGAGASGVRIRAGVASGTVVSRRGRMISRDGGERT